MNGSNSSNSSTPLSRLARLEKLAYQVGLKVGKNSALGGTVYYSFLPIGENSSGSAMGHFVGIAEAEIWLNGYRSCYVPNFGISCRLDTLAENLKEFAP